MPATFQDLVQQVAQLSRRKAVTAPPAATFDVDVDADAPPALATLPGFSTAPTPVITPRIRADANRVGQLNASRRVNAPDARALAELHEVGVTRASLYAPSADANEVLRFLDDVAPLVDATKER